MDNPQKANQSASLPQQDVWFVYDGECPLCQAGAKYYRLKEALGQLHLIDARTQNDHPVMQEIKAKGLNIDKGMAIKFQDRWYHGADALHFMALIGTDKGWLNSLNVCLFRSKMLSVVAYPALKAGRNIALWMKGVGSIRNLEK